MDLSGQTIGGFRILDALQTGAGSQGAVYRAVCDGNGFPDVRQGTVVALKVMPAGDENPDHWARLETRTRELSFLEHPNIVKYHGCFRANDFFHDLYVIVEEFLVGETLKERLSKSPSGLDVDEVLLIANALLDGFDYISSKGIIHRDVKPGNVFLCADGSVKLIDFEVARAADSPATTSGSGNFRGTFDYMAPEFATSEFRGDIKSDIFSMGVVLHEMLSGKLPYPQLEGGRKQASFAFMARWERLAAGGTHSIRISSRIKRLLSGVNEVLERALMPQRDGRFGSFAEFKTALQGVKFIELVHESRVYRLLRFIGKGGFGEVFKARSLQTGEYVAVKHLLKAAYAERFYREARIMAKFNDPCFVRLMDFFVVGNIGSQEAFLVMAFLDGMPGNSLRDAIRTARGSSLPHEDVFRAFARYAHGLSMMHGQGVYHRDIKPSNLYYPKGNPGGAAIMDLGIARDEHGTATHGQVPGTLDYMPPEVIVSDSRGDGGMDIFALGLCLYEALTGKMGYPRLPSGASGYTEFFARARSRKPPDFSDPSLSNRPDVLSLLYEMTDPDETRRLKDAKIVVARLARLGEGAVPLSGPSKPFQAQMQSYRHPEAQRIPHGITVPPSRLRRPLECRDKLQPSGPVPCPSHSPRSDSGNRGGAPKTVRDWKLPLNTIMCGTIVVLLGFFAHWAFPSIKLAIAKMRLDAVCGVYRVEGVEKGELAEGAWLRRWSPRTGGLLALTFPDFVACTNRLCSVRSAAIDRAEKERIRAELAAERAACLGKLGACRRFDGRLDEECFRSLDGWVLPQRFENDEEVIEIMQRIARCLAHAVRTKLDIEPVLTRRERIDAATALLRNSWSSRVLSGTTYSELKSKVEAARACQVGVVGNGCTDTIKVGGISIPPGVTRTIVVQEGNKGALRIERAGYRPVSLPEDFGEVTFAVTDSHFTPAPVKVTVPDVGDDVSCKVNGDTSGPGEFFMLMPGDYTCVYSRPNHSPQCRSFTVRVNAPMELPTPNEWRREFHEKKGTDNASGKKSADGRPLRTVTEAENAELDVRAIVLRSIRRQCAAKLAVEPVDTRQERLDEAGRILTRAVAVDRIVTEEEAASLYEAIERRRKWAAGIVQNDCSQPLVVADQIIPAYSSKVLVFENGIPAKWTAQLKGYHQKTLMRDFDGRILRFTPSDFTPKEDIKVVPAILKTVEKNIGR